MLELNRIIVVFVFCMLAGLLYYLAKRAWYYSVDALYKDGPVKRTMIGLFICGSVLASFIVAIAVPELILEKRNDSIICIAGMITGLVLGAILLKILDRREDMKEYHIISKIKLLEGNLKKIKESEVKSKQQLEAQKVMEETIKTLKLQINDLRIKDSIKVGKEILLKHREIDITKELDELEALQVLSKV